jgi:hypothetical protein
MWFNVPKAQITLIILQHKVYVRTMLPQAFWLRTLTLTQSSLSRTSCNLHVDMVEYAPYA